MMRKKINFETLKKYYDAFTKEGKIDKNLHPYVKESWIKSPKTEVSRRKLLQKHKVLNLNSKKIKEKYHTILTYLDDYMANFGDFLSRVKGALVLLDSECNVVEVYKKETHLPILDSFKGMNFKTENVGTMACNVVYDHKEPFMLFGPENHNSQLHLSTSMAVPIFKEDEMVYILYFICQDGKMKIEEEAISFLFSLKAAVELYLKQEREIAIYKEILDKTPLAIYQIEKGANILYANKMGLDRLSSIRALNKGKAINNLKDVVKNYEDTPLARGFLGERSINIETTWITEVKTYEDITTVVPLEMDGAGDVSSIVAISMPIEDMRHMVAHASGYTAKYKLSSMVGKSPQYLDMMERAKKAAKSKNHIVLYGEVGVGKKRLAQGIHLESSRALGPFISINCLDFAPEMLEDELFGSNNNNSSYPGKLELATRGTLFIDEVEKMPYSVQLMLAKALTNKESFRLGEKVARPIDVRVIFATTTNLRRLTEQKLFEKPLFKILYKGSVKIPSIRSRKEDIPLLSVALLSDISKLNGIEKTLSKEALEQLKSYDWPGNTKQLQRSLENAYLTAKGIIITPEDINFLDNVKTDNSWKTDKDMFARAYKSAGGNISRLSALLGVSRVTLYRYLRKFRLIK